MTASLESDSAVGGNPSLHETVRAFGRIGVMSFGGPAAQIALMHKVVLDEKNWLTEKQFLNALSFCMLLPGPEAMQLATYAGWRLHGVLGGLIAGLLFVLPGAAVILTLGTIYAYLGNVPLVEALFLGIKAAVLVIVIEALLKVSKKALHQKQHWVIAGLAFIGIFFLQLPFPLVVLTAALFGFFRARGGAEGSLPETARTVSLLDTLRTIIVWLVIWLVPLIAVTLFADQAILTEIGTFFSKLAVVTFGGAYAVLAYMAQDVVNQYGWLTAGEMMDGLGLAETTPGPLILVTQFVGFLSAFREGGFMLGLAGALVTLWVTFVPCFLWIFAGAPYIEWIGTQPKLKGALTAITAAVVGVILNLSVWFALHVLFAAVTPTKYGPVTLWQPDLTSVDWRAWALFALCAILAFGLHWGIGRILIVSSLLGALLTLL